MTDIPWRISDPSLLVVPSRVWLYSNAEVVAPLSDFANPFQVVPSATTWKAWRVIGVTPEYQIGVALADTPQAACRIAVDLFDEWAMTASVDGYDSYVAWVREELGGKDVVCTCPLWDEDAPCRFCDGDGTIRQGSVVEPCLVCEGTGFARWPCHGDTLLLLANPETMFPWDSTHTAAADSWIEMQRMIPPHGFPSDAIDEYRARQILGAAGHEVAARPEAYDGERHGHGWVFTPGQSLSTRFGARSYVVADSGQAGIVDLGENPDAALARIQGHRPA